MTIRRGIEVLENRWLTERRYASVCRVDESKLCSRVILIQTLIIRTLQQIFVCSHWTRPARAFLCVWFGWNRRFGGRCAARRRHELDQQRAVVRHPRQRAAHN